MQLGVIGNYSEGTGWSNAITNFILAAKTQMPVMARPLRLNNNPIQLHPELVECENNKFTPTHMVQYVLPPYMTYRSGFKNIGRFVIESDRVIPSWKPFVKLMDEIWVPTKFMQERVDHPNVKIIPENTQVAEIQRVGDLGLKEQSGDEFLFYFIGEMNRRKNLTALVQAFHMEFKDEPVNLVIKTNMGEPTQARQKMIQILNNIKAGLKLRKNYKSELIITEYLTQEQMWRLHKSCDCLVAPSYGEGWHRPALDALCAGNTPIVTGWSSFTDFIDNDCGWLVDYKMVPCTNHIDTLPELNTAKENWAEINIYHLRQCMREAYENAILKQEKGVNGMKKAHNYSNQSVGKLIRTACET